MGVFLEFFLKNWIFKKKTSIIVGIYIILYETHYLADKLQFWSWHGSTTNGYTRMDKVIQYEHTWQMACMVCWRSSCRVITLFSALYWVEENTYTSILLIISNNSHRYTKIYKMKEDHYLTYVTVKASIILNLRILF